MGMLTKFAKEKTGYNQGGSKNNNWGGDSVSYSAKHKRQANSTGNHKKGKKCVRCGATSNLQSSEIHGSNGNRFQTLCTSCHAKYDKKGDNFNKESSMGQLLKFSKNTLSANAYPFKKQAVTLIEPMLAAAMSVPLGVGVNRAVQHFGSDTPPSATSDVLAATSIPMALIGSNILADTIRGGSRGAYIKKLLANTKSSAPMAVALALPTAGLAYGANKLFGSKEASTKGDMLKFAESELNGDIIVSRDSDAKTNSQYVSGPVMGAMLGSAAGPIGTVGGGLAGLLAAGLQDRYGNVSAENNGVTRSVPARQYKQDLRSSGYKMDSSVDTPREYDALSAIAMSLLGGAAGGGASMLLAHQLAEGNTEALLASGLAGGLAGGVGGYYAGDYLTPKLSPTETTETWKRSH